MARTSSTFTDKEHLQTLELLQNQHGYYRALLELTRSENDKLQSPATMGDVYSIARKKNIIFSCIEEIDQKLNPLRNAYIAQGEAIEAIDKEAKIIASIMKEILELDKQNQELFDDFYSSLKSRKEALDFLSGEVKEK